MADVFDLAMDGIFNSPLAVTVTYIPLSGAPYGPVRAIRKAPDIVRDFGQVAVASGTDLFEVRVSQVPAPVEGDQIQLGDGRLLVVQGEPKADRDGRLWTFDTRPA